MRKPTLCLDFDGVVHSYRTGWSNATIIPDPPVVGALEFIKEATKSFTIAIFSDRSDQTGGISAMKTWLEEHLRQKYGDKQAADILIHISYPYTKPSAWVTLDDRAITFTGKFPPVAELLAFKPWHKQD